MLLRRTAHGTAYKYNTGRFPDGALPERTGRPKGEGDGKIKKKNKITDVQYCRTSRPNETATVLYAYTIPAPRYARRINTKCGGEAAAPDNTNRLEKLNGKIAKFSTVLCGFLDMTHRQC